MACRGPWAVVRDVLLQEGLERTKEIQLEEGQCSEDVKEAYALPSHRRRGHGHGRCLAAGECEH